MIIAERSKKSLAKKNSENYFIPRKVFVLTTCRAGHIQFSFKNYTRSEHADYFTTSENLKSRSFSLAFTVRPDIWTKNSCLVSSFNMINQTM